MLTIRLSRIGKRKQPTYRLVIQEKTKDPWGKYLELLGNYNPRTKQLNLKAERIKYWLAHGAQTSATVNNLLINAKIISGAKRKVVRITKRRQEKLAGKKEKTEEKKSAETIADEEAAKTKVEKEQSTAEESQPAENKPEVQPSEDKSTEQSAEAKTEFDKS